MSSKTFYAHLCPQRSQVGLYERIIMEPTLRDIEDYDNHESPQKKRVVNLVVLGLFIFAMAYAGVKIYYDTHMPSIFSPVHSQQQIEQTRGY